MGARKLYEEKILELIKGLSEEELVKVVSLIEREYRLNDPIEQVCGKYSYVKTSSDEYAKRKQEEKSLAR
jgi:hypothetical protein